MNREQGEWMVKFLTELFDFSPLITFHLMPTDEMRRAAIAPETGYYVALRVNGTYAYAVLDWTKALEAIGRFQQIPA